MYTPASLSRLDFTGLEWLTGKSIGKRDSEEEAELNIDAWELGRSGWVVSHLLGGYPRGRAPLGREKD
jgi:hypothetical protein